MKTTRRLDADVIILTNAATKKDFRLVSNASVTRVFSLNIGISRFQHPF
jgi:hypothetical protein